jgi:hypothetical protein
MNKHERGEQKGKHTHKKKEGKKRKVRSVCLCIYIERGNFYSHPYPLAGYCVGALSPLLHRFFLRISHIFLRFFSPTWYFCYTTYCIQVLVNRSILCLWVIDLVCFFLTRSVIRKSFFRKKKNTGS